MESYYIIENNIHHGPFDMVAMMKKIRMGNVLPDTSLCNSKDPDTVFQANQIPQFASYFDELAENDYSNPFDEVLKFSTKQSIIDGWQFILDNQLSVAFAGVLLICGVILNIIFAPAGIIGSIISSALLFVLFTCYLIYLQRINRGQVFDGAYIVSKIKPNILSVLTCGFIIFFPIGLGVGLLMEDNNLLSLIGVTIMVIFGIPMLSLFIFAPMLIVDRNISFIDALSISLKACKNKTKGDIFTIIFTLMFLNYIGAMVFLIPLLFTMPITLSAICNIYDEILYQ